MADDNKTTDIAALRAQLLEKGKKDGKLDQKEIFKLIADTAENLDSLDLLYGELTEAGVELVAAEEPSVEEIVDEWATEDEEEVFVNPTAYLDDVSDDSVRLYLREIGKIPLLTAEQELELAHRVVAGEKDAKYRSDQSGKNCAHDFAFGVPVQNHKNARSKPRSYHC